MILSASASPINTKLTVRSSTEAFLLWILDLGRRKVENLRIERIDQDAYRIFALKANLFE